MTQLVLKTGTGEIHADLARSFDLSIPLRFDGKQPSAFCAPPATTNVFSSGSFLGDVQRGGSCNCREYRLNPHCNGTHTECVGHLTRQRVDICQVARPGLEPALLLSVAVSNAAGCQEATDPKPLPDDQLITAESIAAAWHHQQWPQAAVRALALRTLPNEPDKTSRQYSPEAPPPYLTRQAAQLLVERGIEHLLIDVPSLDRLDDGGKLTAHRLFWGLPPGDTDVTHAARPQAIVTELMFAADHIVDGRYLLDLQLPSFATDAAPSRPILYPVVNR